MSTSQLFNLPPGTRLPIELLSARSKTLSGQPDFTRPYLHIMEANGKLEDIINWETATRMRRTPCHRCLFMGSLIPPHLWFGVIKGRRHLTQSYTGEKKNRKENSEKKKLTKLLMLHLDDTTVHHGVQPLDVRLNWRLFLQQTVKLLVHCESRRRFY